jgi:hypothetical protein
MKTAAPPNAGSGRVGLRKSDPKPSLVWIYRKFHTAISKQRCLHNSTFPNKVSQIYRCVQLQAPRVHEIWRITYLYVVCTTFRHNCFVFSSSLFLRKIWHSIQPFRRALTPRNWHFHRITRYPNFHFTRLLFMASKRNTSEDKSIVLGPLVYRNAVL